MELEIHDVCRSSLISFQQTIVGVSMMTKKVENRDINVKQSPEKLRQATRFMNFILRAIFSLFSPLNARYLKFLVKLRFY